MIAGTNIGAYENAWSQCQIILSLDIIAYKFTTKRNWLLLLMSCTAVDNDVYEQKKARIKIYGYFF